jgi:uncharacterized protein (DUF2461 family)
MAVMGDAFTGFPRAATEFFRDLARNNNREWFQAHKDVYEQACRDPLKGMVGELDPMGTPRISRINVTCDSRATRRRYKTTHRRRRPGIYITVSAGSLGGARGCIGRSQPCSSGLRAAIDAHASGRELAAIVSALRRKRYDVGTHDSVNSAPRGYCRRPPAHRSPADEGHLRWSHDRTWPGARVEKSRLRQ